VVVSRPWRQSGVRREQQRGGRGGVRRGSKKGKKSMKRKDRSEGPGRAPILLVIGLRGIDPNLCGREGGGTGLPEGKGWGRKAETQARDRPATPLGTTVIKKGSSQAKKRVGRHTAATIIKRRQRDLRPRKERRGV